MWNRCCEACNSDAQQLQLDAKDASSSYMDEHVSVGSHQKEVHAASAASPKVPSVPPEPLVIVKLEESKEPLKAPVDEMISAVETTAMHVAAVIDIPVSKQAESVLQEDNAPATIAKAEVPATHTVDVIFKPPVKRVWFWRKPTGITFSGPLLTVASVTGDAEDFGVKAGMTVTGIAGSSKKLNSAEFQKGVVNLRTVVGIRVAFVPYGGGETKTVSFTHQPIGVCFATTAPLRLSDVTGRAHRLGLDVGMLVQTVEGLDVASKPYVDARAVLARAVKSLPSAEAPVQVVFETSNSSKPIFFAERPLGVTFRDEGSRLVVDDVTDQGAELGVQAGWAVTSIQATSVAGLPYSSAFGLLKRAAAKLPQRMPTLLVELQPVETKRVTFTKRPLGIRFLDQQQPPKLVPVCHGLVEQEGVEADWTISTVDGTQVDTLSYDAALAVVRSAEAALPA